MREEVSWQPSPLDQEIMDLLEKAGVREVKIWTRRVRDGHLRAIVSCDPPDYNWHLSVTHHSTRRRKARFPSWEELTHARYELLPGKITMGLYLPPIEEVTEQNSKIALIEVKTSGN